MKEKKKKYAIFTIDVEAFSDTECIQYSGISPDDDMLDGLDEYIGLLNDNGIHATMFAVCDAALKHKDKIKEYLDEGHRLALHGYRHVAPLTISDGEFSDDMEKGKKMLEEEFGVTVDGFRAPCFSIDDGKLSVLRNCGFRYDASCTDFGGSRHRGTVDLKSFKRHLSSAYSKDGFFEYGLSCGKFFFMNYPLSGGGYMRLMNPLLFRILVKRYIKKNDYYVFYLHPFELSKKPVPKYKGLKSYDRFYLARGFSGFPKKISSVIDLLKKEGFEFLTFEELSDKLAEQ